MSDEKMKKAGHSAGCCGRPPASRMSACLLLIACLAVGLSTFVIIRFTTQKQQSQSYPPSEPPTSSPSPPTLSGALTVGAYYYPWHGNDFNRGFGYLRNKLSTRQVPALGESYNDKEPEVISQHLKWSEQANISLWVTSWWGPHSREDNTTRNNILNHEFLGNHNIALHYETMGRRGRILNDQQNYTLQNVTSDIEYICKTYFSHDNYFRIEGRPVLFVYLTRRLDRIGALDGMIQLMRRAAFRQGHNIYIVGDQVFGTPKDNQDTAFQLLDAVTNFDVYGSMGRPSPYATLQDVKEHYRIASEWKEMASQHDCAYVASVSPGYNDLGVRFKEQHPPLSRFLQNQSNTPGSFFRSSLRFAKQLVDPNAASLILVNSFNEWHEDTQIEPCVGENSALPYNLTMGIEYEGYGELYLNILRNETQ